MIAGEGADDGLPYVNPRESRGLPGTRAPHVWLERDGERISTLDLFGRHLTVLAADDGAAWCDAASAAATQFGVTLEIRRIGGADGLADPDRAFPEAYGISATGATIVRPDGYVGWRTAEGAEASRESVLRALAALLSLGERSTAS